MNINQFKLLQTRRLLPLFVTQFLGAFNDNVYKNALAILITYRLAEQFGYNAQLLVTLATGIFILPYFLLSATAGQLADKYEKGRLISRIKLAEIGIMTFAVVGFYFQSVFLLMLALFFLGVQATFFGPLKYAILPEQLHENELIAGNSLVEAGTFLAILLGMIVGGKLVLYPLGEWIISLAILGFAVSGYVSSLYIPRKQARNPHLNVSYNVIQETIRLMQYAHERWDIYASILGISWFWLIGATFLTELPVFTKDVLHGNQNLVTFFWGLFSVGIALGSLSCNRLLKDRVDATYVPVSALGMSIFILDLFFASRHVPSLAGGDLMTLGYFLSTFKGWHITLDLLLMAICGGIYSVPLYAILQQRSEESHRARVMASNNVMNALFMVIAAIATMLMLWLGFSVSSVFLTTAIANSVVAIYVCKLLPDALVRAIFTWLLKTLYRVEVVGMENYQRAGNRVVIISNHTSYLDALLLAIFLPDKLTYAVDTLTSQKWWIKLFLNLVDAFPMHPTNPMAIKSLIEFVEQDKRCVIFPEGRLTMTGALMKIYEGPGLVADKSGAKLLPIRIQGAQFTPFSRLRGKVPIQWLPKITLKIFPAQTLDVPDSMKGRQRRQQIGYKLYDVMTKMMFESSGYQKTVFASLLDAKSTHGRYHRIAEDVERDPIHYQQFITRSFILGSLIARETSPGDPVGVLLPNMVSTAITFFALHAYGRVPAMINFTTGIKNVVTACETAQIKTVYTAKKFVEFANLSEMVKAMEAVGVRVVFLDSLRKQVTVWDKLKGVLMAQFPQTSYKLINRAHAATTFNLESSAVIIFTSGSEGTPKGVVLSHKNVQSNRCQLSACVDFNASDIILNALPVFHSFGLTGGMFLPILSGVKVFFYPSPLHYRIVPELSYDINATILFGTDTFLSGYAKHAHPYDFYSVRYVFAGAEKLREETRTIWAQKFGVRIFEGYGTSETSPVLATNTPMQNRPGTVGRLLPGIRYQIKAIPGIEEGGELLVSGPNIMKGYLKADNPGVIQPPVDGWYDTGDIVSVDQAGFVTIKGRVKRFAKIGGEMVSLTMVEQQVNLLWPGFQHAVVNLPDTRKGEQILLVTTNPQASREALVANAKANLMAEISIPKKIVIVKALPLLGSGKIDYTTVKASVLLEVDTTEVEEEDEE